MPGGNDSHCKPQDEVYCVITLTNAQNKTVELKSEMICDYFHLL